MMEEVVVHSVNELQKVVKDMRGMMRANDLLVKSILLNVPLELQQKIMGGFYAACKNYGIDPVTGKAESEGE